MTDLLQKVRYGGNPEHKKNPGDFKLDPPCSPRRDKNLCDIVGIFCVKEALKLLKRGIKKGLVSAQKRGNFPQNIWTVTSKNEVLEAQLENQDTGVYHGYPVPQNDPFLKEILKHWQNK